MGLLVMSMWSTKYSEREKWKSEVNDVERNSDCSEK